MNEPLRVLAFVPYPLGVAPSQRYRLEQWAPYLEEAGVKLVFRPFASPDLGRILYEKGRTFRKAALLARGLIARRRHLREVEGADAVLVHREACLLGPPWVERRLARTGKPFVYDFDDAIWLPNASPANRPFAFLKRPSKTAEVCRLATAVTVGNDALADFARKRAREVHVVPSTVSLRQYAIAPKPPPDVPTLGWTGSHSSARYLERLREPLAELAARRRFRFVVIGAEGVALPGVSVEFHPWRAATEVEDLATLDVGVMPLDDDEWARGKCAMKAVQYMGLGIPAVVSPVGANTALVRDGDNGFLASTHQEWVRSLEKLLTDPGLRSRLGAAARKTVERGFSAEAQAPRLARILREVTGVRSAD